MGVKTKQLKIKTKRGIFNIVLKSKEGEEGYVIRVEGFPEIVTGGDTLKEVKKMAKEAIEFCLECRENEHHPNTKIKRSSLFTSPTRF